MLDSNSGRPNQKTICTYRQFAILENVLNLLTERMSGIRDFVLEEFAKRKMKVHWAAVSGQNVGINVYRGRVFLVATKGDFHFKDASLKMAAAWDQQCQKAWNPSQRPALTEWLTTESSEQDESRLHALGNIVFPRCAELAVSLIEEKLRRG
ncbi:unnamed protein product [Durusdinium trenchii]|uniref:DNA (cytosine-5-)-methyltransferase n=1 Tax=Durusdinium trenchii TaxID=1381693 RepID=A0ABP0MMK5_9DINO